MNMHMQSTHHILMIRPAHFAGNAQTAASNHFQKDSAEADVHQRALAEFDAVVNALRSAGVVVNVIEDTLQPHKPDAIFPNNWVSFHDDGTVVLYPMLAANRRLERRMDVLQRLSERGYYIKEVIDLSGHESVNQFLEGTGSMVLDRVNKLAYACLSPRTDVEVLGEFAQRLDYELVVFDATDNRGWPIYHTNVLMCVGTRFAVVCVQAIASHERAGVLHALQSTGHDIVEISMQQMYCFAGNMLELKNQQGETMVVMSQAAHDSLLPAQRAQLQSLAGRLVTVSIPVIETHGGGSVRCMIAEVFAPFTR